MAESVRKSITALTLADFAAYPVWEYASDEENEPGQDETTVRPYLGVTPTDYRGEPRIVHAGFQSADGNSWEGFVFVGSGTDLPALQPVIIGLYGHIGLWFGGIEPTPDDLRADIEKLGKPVSQFFPLTFLSSAGTVSALGGVITGFMFLGRDGTPKFAKL